MLAGTFEFILNGFSRLRGEVVARPVPVTNDKPIDNGDLVRLNSMVDDKPVIARVYITRQMVDGKMKRVFNIMERDDDVQSTYGVPDDKELLDALKFERIGSMSDIIRANRQEHAQFMAATEGRVGRIVGAKVILGLASGVVMTTREAIRNAIENATNEGDDRVRFFHQA